MANRQSGNSFYVDSASSASTSQSFVSITPSIVTQIVFTSSSAGDSIVLCDLAPPAAGGSPAAGNNKITIKNNLATDSKVVRFSDNPIVFPNGVWVASISSGATCTLIGVSQGSG